MGRFSPDVDVFVEVVAAGSFARAAERLHLTRSAAAKAIARLETRLNARLFNRNTRSQNLTEAGATYYEYCLRALDEMKNAEQALESGKAEIAGRLRVSVPVLFGHLCLTPLLVDMAGQHPQLLLDLMFTDRMVDLMEEGVDLAIRNGHPPDSGDLVAKRLGEHQMVFCAAPGYLRRSATIFDVAALERLDAVAYTRHGRMVDWQLVVEGRAISVHPNARMQIDDLQAVMDAAVAGMGIAWLPSWLARDKLVRGSLWELKTVGTSTVFPINALWPRTRYMPRKLRAAIDLLVEKLPAQLAMVEG